MKARASQAAALHRQAAATATAAATVLDAVQPAPADQRVQHELAERLRAAASSLTPGWLGAPLDAQSANTPLGGSELPGFVRVGIAQPFDDTRFPVVVPLLGTGHLSIDADARDPRVAGLLRAVLLRLLAAAPAGSLLVRGVDAAGGGALFAPFARLTDAGLLAPPVTDHSGLRAVLTETEQWIRPVGPGGARPRHDHTLLLVIASLPELTDGTDLVRIATLAEHGPEAGLHLVVAGWPPPPLTVETAQPPLPRATMIAVRNPHALVGDPPGASFGSPAAHLPAIGLNSPVFLDDDPPAHLCHRVCEELGSHFVLSPRRTLGDLLPDLAHSLWQEDPGEGLTTVVGHDVDTPVTLRFNDLTPHWLVAGRLGAGKTAFVTNVLYGLASAYHPNDLGYYLADFSSDGTLEELMPSPQRAWLPQLRAIGLSADREYGLALLRELDEELARRASAAEQAQVTRFAELRRSHRLPRLLCVLKEFQLLLGGRDRIAAEALTRLESLARKGRSYGIHLVLVSRSAREVKALHAKRDSVFGQFPVRVALPGGGEILEPTNDAAASLPLGSAVVNTAGGLGGPRGATRGHERVVRFPDPYADRGTLATYRRRLWEARDTVAPPPAVFSGTARLALTDDPVYRTGAPAGPDDSFAVLLGRVIDVAVSTAAFPLDRSPGRHLALLGSASVGAELLAVAVRSLAVQHRPGTARFVLASLVPVGDEVLGPLATSLAERHTVEVVDGPGLAKALETEQPGYLVVFGMDAARPEQLPPDRFRALLSSGPGREVHLLSWWRSPRRFAEQAGGGQAGGEPPTVNVNGLVFLNVSGTDVSLVLGQAVEWRPRPDRALLYDRRTGEPTVIVPFTRPTLQERRSAP